MARPPSDQPSVKVWGPTGDTFADAADALNKALRILDSLMGVPVLATLGADGKLPVPHGIIKVAPNVPADVDEVITLDLTQIADGRWVDIELNSSTQPVTLKHLGAGGTVSGEIELVGDVDLILSSADHRVRLQRRGNRLIEIGRFNFAEALNSLQNNLNANRKAITNVARIVEARAGTVSVVTGDRDKLLECSGSAVSLPTNPTGWDKGDRVDFVQMGADLIFSPAVNIVHPLGHDRGLGAGARMAVEVHDDTVNPMKWRLVGQTKAAAGGGGGSIERTFVKSLLTTTIITDASSTAWKSATSVTHTPGANEKWLYVSTGAFQAGPNNSTNKAKVRLMAAGDTAWPQSQAGRYAIHAETPSLILGKSYGASPGSQTINLDIMSANTLYTAQIASPGIVGLKLEADEYLSLLASDATTASPHDTAIDAHSFTQTTLADDYLVVAWGTWEAASGQGGASLSLTIDGTEYDLVNRSKDGAGSGAATGAMVAVKPVTLTAASHTFKIRVKSNVGTVSATVKAGAGIALLKKSRFQAWHMAENRAEASTTATAFASRVNSNQTWTNNWDYLVLAGCNLRLSIETGSGAAQAKLVKAGVDLLPIVENCPRLNDTYSYNSTLLATIFRGSGAAQDVALQWADRRADETAYIQGAVLAVLPLKLAA